MSTSLCTVRRPTWQRVRVFCSFSPARMIVIEWSWAKAFKTVNDR
jgi:hypothetical protein